MKKNRKIVGILLLLSIILFSGCTDKKPTIPVINKKIVINEIGYPSKTIYPVLKENNLGQRAIVDMGVVLKTKITTYKDKGGSLIASHDVFFWAKKPDFITTNTLPRKDRKKEYSGLKINLSQNGVIDLGKEIEIEAISDNEEAKNNAKIDTFLELNKKD